jgi:putative ATP-grasp target RiPP
MRGLKRLPQTHFVILKRSWCHRSGPFGWDGSVFRLRSVEPRDAEWPPEGCGDTPLSSASLRYSLSRAVAADGPGPPETRPLGLRFAQRVPAPVRPEVCYCHQRQVAVDDVGRPLIERMGWEEDQKKEWESKTYSDGDEGQEEDVWGWEEEH